jgi:hypothetical protein
MSETTTSHILPTAKQMWREGKLRTFYRGLVVRAAHPTEIAFDNEYRLALLECFLIPVILCGGQLFSSDLVVAIDMSTFEALKLAYLRSTELEEPGVLALLAFGSISGSVGATVRSIDHPIFLEC